MFAMLDCHGGTRTQIYIYIHKHNLYPYIFIEHAYIYREIYHTYIFIYIHIYIDIKYIYIYLSLSFSLSLVGRYHVPREKGVFSWCFGLNGVITLALEPTLPSVPFLRQDEGDASSTFPKRTSTDNVGARLGREWLGWDGSIPMIINDGTMKIKISKIGDEQWWSYIWTHV
jgi:hypothetical protein